jgi:hypothetical protein
LYDQAGKVMLNFNSTHNGMGKFLLVPDKQDAFYAVWKDEKNVEHRTELPPVKSSGIVLKVLNTNQKLIFNVARPLESLTNQQVIVIAHMEPANGFYKAVVNLKEARISAVEIFRL